MNLLLSLCFFTVYPSSHLDTLYYLYRKGNYKKIIELTENPDTFGMDKKEKAQVFLLRGIAFIAFRDFKRAEESFKICLDFNPSLKLNKKDYSPLILKTFYDVKKKIEKKKEVIPKVLPAHKSIKEKVVQYRRPTFPDLIIPGLYTIRYKKKIKGYIILSGFLISTLSFFYSNYKFNQYYDKYMEAREKQSIEYYYKKSKFYYNLRNSFSISLIFFPLWNFYEITH